MSARPALSATRRATRPGTQPATQPATRRPVRGFTLIEVLVAIAVLALMAAMAWQGVDGIVRSKAAAEGRLDRLLVLDTALSQWAADVRAVQDTRGVPPMSFDGNTLRLTRRTDDGIQIVAWTLRDGVWRRWTSPAVTRRGELQAWWLRSQALAAERELAAVPGLTQWEVYYFRDGAWTNPQSIAGAPSVAAATPEGVRVVLTLGDLSDTAAGAPAGTFAGTFAGTISRDILLRRPGGA